MKQVNVKRLVIATLCSGLYLALAGNSGCGANDDSSSLPSCMSLSNDDDTPCIDGSGNETTKHDDNNRRQMNYNDNVRQGEQQ
jgi:hypothetical protein